MSQEDHKNCYGTMFPSTLHTEADRRITGKAFWLELNRIGGIFAWDRRVGVDIPQWDDCTACSEFEDCYKLCLGRLALEAAIAAR